MNINEYLVHHNARIQWMFSPLRCEKVVWVLHKESFSDHFSKLFSLKQLLFHFFFNVYNSFFVFMSKQKLFSVDHKNNYNNIKNLW